MCTQILQKCDAKRPCATCVNCGGESGCFYEELRIPHHVIPPLPSAAPAFPFSDGDVLGPPSDGQCSYRLPSRTERVAVSSENPGLRVRRPVRSDPDPEFYFSSADPVERDLSQLPSTSHTSRGPGSLVPGGTRHHVRSGPQHTTDPLSPSTSSRLFVLPSLRLSVVPRPLHTPLSFFPPENFQVAGETPGNLEMSLYAFPTAFPVHR